MCQLLALSSNAPAALTFAFAGFSERGGRTGEHADGFGLAFHDGPGCRLFVDDAPACDSPLADYLRRQPIRARTILAHIRKATQGPVRASNCHPFVREWQGRHWSFCHNGDLGAHRPRLCGPHLPVGETDSEAAFCWMLQELRRRFGATGRGADWRDLAPVLAQLADRLARHGRFNFLLSDGQALYAHCSTRLHWLQRRHPFETVQLVDRDLALDLSTVNGPDDRMVLVATEPLTRNERWIPFEAGELRVFVDGEPVWQRARRPLRRAVPVGAPIPAGAGLQPA